MPASARAAPAAPAAPVSAPATRITLLDQPTADEIKFSFTGEGSPKGARASQVQGGGIDLTTRTAEVCQAIAAQVTARPEFADWASFLPARRAAGKTTYLYVRGTSVTDFGPVRGPFLIKMLPTAAAATKAAADWLSLAPAALEQATSRISGATPGGLVLLAKLNYGRPPAAGAHAVHTTVVEMVAA